MDKKNIFTVPAVKLLVALILCLLAGVLLDGSLASLRNSDSMTGHFQKVLHKKEQLLAETASKILANVAAGQAPLGDTERLKVRNLLLEENCALNIYQNDSLIFWTDNSIEAEEQGTDRAFTKKATYIKNGNAWYLVKEIDSLNYRLVRYIRIRYDFPYENRFLKNRYVADFKTGSNQIIDTANHEGNLPVFDLSGNKVFSFVSGIPNPPPSFPLLASLAYLGAFICLLLMLSGMLESLLRKKFLLRILSQLALFALFRYLALGFPNVEVFDKSELFSPYYYASNGLQSSLGDFLINTLFLLLFISRIQLPTELKTNKVYSWSLFIFWMLGINGFILYMDSGISRLVSNSTIEFNVAKLLQITPQTVLAYLSLAFLVLAFILFTQLAIRTLRTHFAFKHFGIGLLIAGLLSWGSSLLFQIDFPFYRYILILLLPLALAWFYRKEQKATYSQRVLLLFLSTLYISSNVLYTASAKECDIREVMAVNLAAEQDFLAETFLDEIENQLAYDVELANLITQENDEAVYDYLGKKYFTGYWNKYDYQAFVCSNIDSIYNEDDGTTYSCFNFFNSTIDSLGMLVSSAYFYFIDNKDGRISYIGRIPMMYSDDISETTLYIVLDTKIASYQLGYPELLLRDDQTPVPHNYSYAKYQNGRLVASTGSFLYSLEPNLYLAGNDEFTITVADGWNHLAYRANPNNIIIVSMPATTFFNGLVFISYLFVFFHLAYTLFLLFIHFPGQVAEFRLNIKNRIRFSMITLVVISMILVGGVTIFYNIKQYNEHHFENLSEKIQSVLVELEHKVGDEHQLTASMADYLTWLLIKFSNVFYTDINLYGTDGKLLASSRPEIFEQHLLGRQMDAEAWYQLHSLKQSKFVNNEQVSTMNYLSAYVPFINNDNEVLAYLNLPYFTRQSMLQNEISALITAVTNIYVFLILLAIFITLFISNNITRPLRLIQKHMSEIKLGGPTQGIDYKGEDEIGQLIDQYNKMVVQLNENVQKLAKNERELAWREMARQIAHEIKNPLTPMRLHLQHLQKSIHEKQPGWEERFEKVLALLISQIDSLNRIASEFGNFAQLPRSEMKQFDLHSLVNELELLFTSGKNIRFSFVRNFQQDLQLNSDRELLKGMIINLVKNAREAIPEGRNGQINIEFEHKDNKLFCKVEDNGSGISKEIESKLFQPNFTTKSSGTGLGLAIVKKSAEEIGASIWYKTREGEGSVFVVEIPLNS